MVSLAQTLLFILDIAVTIIIIHIVMGWLLTFNVLNARQPLVAQIWTGLETLLGPIYRRIRSFLPPMGGLDLSPIILFIAIYFLRALIFNNLF